MSLLEELQRNPQLKQLATSRLLKWSDLMSSTEETLPDGTKARVIDYKDGIIVEVTEVVGVGGIVQWVIVGKDGIIWK
eukprot:COSAG02_NODE_910_length_16005_cov_46.458569_4_plen_78_part_00